MKKKIFKIVVIVVIIAGLLLTAHLVANNLNLTTWIRQIHGG